MSLAGFSNRLPVFWQPLVYTSFHTGDDTALLVASGTQLLLGGVTCGLQSFSPARDDVVIKLGATPVLQWTMPSTAVSAGEFEPLYLDLSVAPILGADGADLVVNKATSQNALMTFRYVLI